MNSFFSELYDRLLSEIGQCEQESADPSSYIECCFHRCERACMEIDNVISSTDFQSSAEEIEFFRNVKPRFTGLTEFYSILYRTELFAPESEKDRQEFLPLELERVQQFFEKNAEFVDYLRSGDTSRDAIYFVRTGPHATECSMDAMLAKIAGRERYKIYLEQKPGTGNSKDQSSE